MSFLRQRVRLELPVLAVGLIGTLVLLVSIRRELTVDSWLALVAGRDVVTSGLPSTEKLTLWGLGRPWVDQQWLGQVLIYGLEQLGGLRLALLANAVWIGLAFVLAFAVGRWRGGSAESVALVGVGTILTALSNVTLRPQSLVYALFVVLLWLLLADARAPSRRVVFVFPLLVLWANLHGSVLLAAGLVVLYGLTEIGAARRADAHRLLRGAALVVVAVASIFVSPYALDLPGYYFDLLGTGQLKELSNEWQPTTLPQGWPFLILALAGVGILGRAGHAATAFERLAFIAMLLVGLTALRNMVWFGFLAVVILPVLLDRIWTSEKRATKYATFIAAAAGAASVVVAFIYVVSRPASWFEGPYPAPAAKALKGPLSDDDTRVLADAVFPDWILWKHPEAHGRVAFDIRYELYTEEELDTLQELARSDVQSWREASRGFDLIVLRVPAQRKVMRAFLSDHSSRAIYRGERVVVIKLD